MKKIVLLLFTFPLLLFSQSKKEKLDNKELFVMFYNVENLFDTIDNPHTNDNEFLPNSNKSWNSNKYNYKLKQLERVFASLAKNENNDKMPDIIGLCEVENRLVIEDLASTPIFLNQKYNIIHRDSPDGRGIDCALLFNRKFKILKKDFIVISNPKAKRPTREIVYVKLELDNKFINVFVNHWPSRWGGQSETNYKRVYVAEVLEDYIDSNIPQNEYTIIMGDFNDYPSNESISKLISKNNFVNLMSSDMASGIGSYNYKGNWGWLDQIIVSKNFYQPNIKLLSIGAFQRDFMLYKNKNGDVFPSRSFGGSSWYGGFSDHLPVYFKSTFIN